MAAVALEDMLEKLYTNATLTAAKAVLVARQRAGISDITLGRAADGLCKCNAYFARMPCWKGQEGKY